MKKIIIVVVLVVGAFGGLIYLSNANGDLKQSEKISTSGLNTEKKLSETVDLSMTHERMLRNVDLASEHRLQGGRYIKQGRLELAAKEFEAAYRINKGSRAVSGILLAETYEKMDRYEDAMTVLDKMINDGVLSENGIKNANEIKARIVKNFDDDFGKN